MQEAAAAEQGASAMASRRLGTLRTHLRLQCQQPIIVTTPAEAAAATTARRSVGVLLGPTEQSCPGPTLFSKGRSTLLIDSGGELLHEWKSNRVGGASYLQSDGTLMRFGQSPRWNGVGKPRDETDWNNTHWSAHIGAQRCQRTLTQHWQGLSALTLRTPYVLCAQRSSGQLLVGRGTSRPLTGAALCFGNTNMSAMPSE
eukprot:SAG11_NODE_515_length_8826_cov_11.352469_6_plen_200_part_00